MLDVIEPDALVHGAISAMEDSVAIRFVVEKFSFVEVAIRVPKNALSVRLVVFPLALVLGAVLPHLDTEAVSHTSCTIVHFISVY